MESLTQLPEFTYEKLHLNTTNSEKWYVGYTLVFPDGTTDRRREHGKKNYDISLTKEKDLGKRERLGNKLKGLVLYDLERGVDPNKRNEILENKLRKQKEQEKEEDDKKISIDSAIQMCKEAKGWINAVEGKDRTATTVPMFFTNQLKPYFESINKADDIRHVTRTDIKKFIELHFNPSADSNYKEWSASSCTIYRGWIGILFGVLLDKELITINPVEKIKIKSDSEKIISSDEDDIDRFEPWLDKEIEIWFADLKGGTALDRLMYVTSHLFHYAFIRKTEMLRLRCWMIDFDNERLTLPPKITKSARKYSSKNLINVDMPDALMIALKEWIEFKFPDGYSDDDYLIGMDNSPLVSYSYAAMTSHYVRMRKKFQLKYKGLFIDKNQYALKHSGVQKLFRTLSKHHKTPVEIQTIIKNQCRHSSFTQTETYLRRLKLEFEGSREKVNF